MLLFDSLTRELWLALNLQQFSCFWLPSARMKDVHHYTWYPLTLKENTFSLDCFYIQIGFKKHIKKKIRPELRTNINVHYSLARDAAPCPKFVV